MSENSRIQHDATPEIVKAHADSTIMLLQDFSKAITASELKPADITLAQGGSLLNLAENAIYQGNIYKKTIEHDPDLDVKFKAGLSKIFSDSMHAIRDGIGELLEKSNERTWEPLDQLWDQVQRLHRPHISHHRTFYHGVQRPETPIRIVPQNTSADNYYEAYKPKNDAQTQRSFRDYRGERLTLKLVGGCDTMANTPGI